MAKKEKEKKSVLNFKGTEYDIESMTGEQKTMLNHINDLQNKINTNKFMADQLEVGKEAFIDMFEKSLEESVEEE